VHHIKTMLTFRLLSSINTQIIKMNTLTRCAYSMFAGSDQSLIKISLILHWSIQCWILTKRLNFV